MPASKRDVEFARAAFGDKGNITEYIVRLGVSIENTTWSEVDAMHGGRPAGGGLQDKGEERQADGHKVQPE